MMKGMQLLFCHIVPTEASAPRLFVNSRRINASRCHYALRESSFDKSFVEKRSRISLIVTFAIHRRDDVRRDKEYSGTPRICTWLDAFLPRQNSSTTTVTTLAIGQSGILFSKLPRLNQRIALNGALLVNPPFSSFPAAPFRPFTHELFISSTQLNARGSVSLEVSQKYRSGL